MTGFDIARRYDMVLSLETGCGGCIADATDRGQELILLGGPSGPAVRASR